MGNDSGLFTAKSVSKRMKAKGLLKLRWYCQMCQKQCRDENGFKCHCISDSHMRQMALFTENPDKYLGSFSNQFKSDFMRFLKYRFSDRRILANTVYQEYISDRHHVHMNSTQWDTLTTFVHYLHRNGLVEADETDKGWFITYVDRDPASFNSEASKKKTRKLDDIDERDRQRTLQRQIEAGELLELTRKHEKPTNIDPTFDRRVGFVLQAPKKMESKLKKSAEIFRPKEFVDNSNTKSNQSSFSASKALVEILKEENDKRDANNRRDYWLTEKLIIKITSSRFGGNYKNQKAIVNKVIDLYEAEIELEDENKLRVSQSDVETVIPRIGGTVMIVNGSHRESLATLEAIDEAGFSCTVKIESGPFLGVCATCMKYDDICKIHLDDD